MKVGAMYYYGLGTKKDYILAYAWLNLSLSNLDKKNRQYVNSLILRLERILTQSQIIYAQNLDPRKQAQPFQKKQQKSPSTGITGTGFFVNATHLLTNNHVVKKCKRIELVNASFKSEAEVVVRDSVNDLAVLKSKKTNNSFLVFRSGRSVRIGDEIVVLGYPMGVLLGSGIKLTSGNISALTGLVNDTTRVQLTAPVQPGNSGGPLLDRSANVAGVIVARLEKGLSGRNAQNVNLAIKSNIAQVFLDTNNIDYEVRISKEKKEMADIADESKKAVVQVLCYE
jgi:S1-C subfamily serine protease